MKPITAIIKEKGGAKTYPTNQEVTLNADGSGGPISICGRNKSPFKQTEVYSRVNQKSNNKKSSYDAERVVRDKNSTSIQRANDKKVKTRSYRINEDGTGTLTVSSSNNPKGRKRIIKNPDKAQRKMDRVNKRADGIGGAASIAKQVRKAKNPATKPTNKVTESYDEKRSKRRGSGNYLPKVKEPLQNRGVQSNPAKERQRQRAIEREETENKRRGSSPLQKKDACYSKVKSRYKKWPSAYASGALVKCRKVGAANWGNKSKK